MSEKKTPITETVVDQASPSGQIGWNKRCSRCCTLQKSAPFILASLMFYLYKLNLNLAHSSKASSSLHSAMQLSLQGGLCSCRNAPCHCLRSHGYQLTPVPFQTTTAKASTRCADHLGEDLTKIRPRSFPKYHSVWLTVASRTLAGLRFQLIRSIYIK